MDNLRIASVEREFRRRVAEYNREEGINDVVRTENVLEKMIQTCDVPLSIFFFANISNFFFLLLRETMLARLRNRACSKRRPSWLISNAPSSVFFTRLRNEDV